MLLFPSPKIRTADLQNPPLPADYVPYLSNPAYMEREIRAQPGFNRVGSIDCPGVTWKYGPFRFERYVSDTEPPYDATGPYRLVTWQRVCRTDRPDGWKESKFVMSTSRTGFATIDNDPAYYKKWTEHAQRHRKRWLKALAEWEIVPITVDEYLGAYKRSRQDAFLKFLFSNLLKQKAKSHGELLHIVGVKRRAPHAEAEAGFAFVDVPETHQSIHLMSFHTDVAKEISAGTGLMDHWFERAPEHGIRYLEFGSFWSPGEPNSWKGFSKFKGQFCITYHDYPRPMARWMGQKPKWWF